ncbi:MAG: hypothetical protein A4E74_02253 [Syntrophus sp. PtaB.Bin075]|nr:MAG: hypothetical protein A4E74_02253 [Syntrophus sp. PtaB.Bin075]
MRLRSLLFLIFVIFIGCVPNIPKEALQLSPESLNNRQLQTRRFDTDEKTLLSASSAVLQDIGFNLDESETALGVIVGSKKRSAVNVGQIIGAVFVAALTGVPMATDKDQLIRASVVTYPVHVDSTEKSKCSTAVRITIQRIVTNTQGIVTRQECIIEPKVYQEFFYKLSQSLFLEGHQI